MNGVPSGFVERTHAELWCHDDATIDQAVPPEHFGKPA